jgi:small subunit ribosomal protein S9
MEVIKTIGRRKTAVARVIMSPGNGGIQVNGKDYKVYFPTETLQTIINQPFAIVDELGKFDIQANLGGGGITGQAEALRLAISRALVENNADNRPPIKKEGFLTRDPRMVERKKYGRAKARKRFQFSKR